MKKNFKKTDALVLTFKEITTDDVNLVGGKCAVLGELQNSFTGKSINMADGFAITTTAYKQFIDHNNLSDRIHAILNRVNKKNLVLLKKRSKEIRELIQNAQLPMDIKDAVNTAYVKLGEKYFKNPDVAVRSSATTEDSQSASFAGQQDTYLNIVGIKAVYSAILKCFASQFTDRAISYRLDKGIIYDDVSMAVCIQKMVRSDLASSGVVFTIDPESGFDKVIVIGGTYGLGELLVRGDVTPDEFMVFKPSLLNSNGAIIHSQLGLKNKMMVYGNKKSDSDKSTKISKTTVKQKNTFCLNNHEVLSLAKMAHDIEHHFSIKSKTVTPMDIEWAKDGQTDKIYIVQARPETVHAQKKVHAIENYVLQGVGKQLLSGSAIGNKIATGKVSVLLNSKQINKFKKGDVLVTGVTDPDWEPIMKIASGIITDRGGRTSHAAIVARELGIPAIIGTQTATKVLKNRQLVTLDCSSKDVGIIYSGALKFVVNRQKIGNLPKLRTKIMLNIGSPSEAFYNHYLPHQGVGLGRVEFIISSNIKVHPNALIAHKNKMLGNTQNNLRAKIDDIIRGYKDGEDFYVSKLAQGMARIASVAYPHPAIMRFSDFKSNEYRTLIGGDIYEPSESNPMIGWRGASRYYHDRFAEAFSLECSAIKMARSDIGLTNIIPMLPFVRTVEEATKVINILKKNGINRESDKTLKIYMMAEIPSNVILIEEFLDIFDGISIGSNDLTQLTLGIDRDSEIMASLGNENNPAVIASIKQIILACKKRKKYVGICGQAPSDYPDFAKFLVKCGIDSISLNPDAVLKTIQSVAGE